MNVLHVIPSLDYGGAARQLVLLATGLPREQFACRVCVLGKAGPWAERLAAAAVPVRSLRRQRLLDLPFLRGLLEEVRQGPADVLHVWGLPALRWVAAAALGRGRRIVVSEPWAGRPSRRRPGRLDRWLLRRADRVVAGSAAEAERCRRAGVDESRLVVIPAGVEPPSPRPASPPARELPAGRLLVSVGPLARHRGHRDALWTVDILRYLYGDLQLALVGQGPEEDYLRRFARAADISDRVHFLGPQPEVREWLERADVVWVPSAWAGGDLAALEAMAAGRPVVATTLPELTELVSEGETGFLVPPGDKAALARQTRRLLDDAELRRRMGEAGRRRAAERFAAADMVRRYAEVYAGR
ncbi:MAG TPA: glycosyltransferase [Gemmataceae bacterium]|nr:glycosyltransferase [Gemmataceae bacterium]